VTAAGAPTRPSWGLTALVAVVVVAADQLTKWWAIEALADGPVAVVGSLRFRLIFNEASAFSIGGGSWWGPIVTVAGLVIIAGLLWFLRSSTGRLSAVAVGLVIGGAVGNLIDRAARSDRGFMGGGVVDFVDLGWWPVFNVADAAVVIGVILLLVLSFLPSRESSDPGAGVHADD
jgi:signal peptidase II